MKCGRRGCCALSVVDSVLWKEAPPSPIECSRPKPVNRYRRPDPTRTDPRQSDTTGEEPWSSHQPSTRYRLCRKSVKQYLRVHHPAARASFQRLTLQTGRIPHTTVLQYPNNPMLTQHCHMFLTVFFFGLKKAPKEMYNRFLRVTFVSPTLFPSGFVPKKRG